jgi:hypothetical protein
VGDQAGAISHLKNALSAPPEVQKQDLLILMAQPREK